MGKRGGMSRRKALMTGGGLFDYSIIFLFRRHRLRKMEKGSSVTEHGHNPCPVPAYFGCN